MDWERELGFERDGDEAADVGDDGMGDDRADSNASKKDDEGV